MKIAEPFDVILRLIMKFFDKTDWKINYTFFYFKQPNRSGLVIHGLDKLSVEVCGGSELIVISEPEASSAWSSNSPFPTNGLKVRGMTRPTSTLYSRPEACSRPWITRPDPDGPPPVWMGPGISVKSFPWTLRSCLALAELSPGPHPHPSNRQG